MMDTLVRAIFVCLNKTYVQTADVRQKAAGLQYMTAETHDLARGIAKLLRATLVGSIGIDAMIHAVQREIQYRARVYPRLVREMRMTQAQADQEIERMTAVLDLVRLLQPHEEPIQGEIDLDAGPARV